MKELTILEEAEQQRQESLNTLFVGKTYSDAKMTMFMNKKVYISKKVNTSNFKGVEFITESNPNFSKSAISARLFHTVKRPGRPVIRVYSDNLYGFSVGHLVSLANEMNPKKILSKLSIAFRAQEPSRPLPISLNVG